MKFSRDNLRKTAAALFALLVLGFAFYLAAWRSPDSGSVFAGEVVALSVIGAIAVGIERVIESYWAFWEWTGNARNPLGPLSREYRRMMAELEQSVRPLIEQAAEAVGAAVKVKKWTKKQAADAQAEWENMREVLAQLPDSIRDPEFAELGVRALKSIAVLERQYPELEAKARAAGMAIDSAVNFVDTFKENPGRRLISIYFGAVLGLILVWITGLDLFRASLGTGEVWAGARLGTAFTGLILGLGASPTHEVIQILKEIKRSRQAGNR